MKKNSLLSILLVGIFGFMTSCSSSDDCHDCHIALYNAAGAEVGEHEIGEFCGNDLEDVESAGYNLEEAVTYSDGDSTYTLPAGLIPAENIHCEEHGDHDHDE